MLWPGRKQIFRRYDSDGRMNGDVMTLAGDQLEGEALIQPVMLGGRRIAPALPLKESRARALSELNRLPDTLKQLARGPEYPVRVAQAIQQLARQVDAKQSRVDDGQPSKHGLANEQPSVG